MHIRQLNEATSEYCNSNHQHPKDYHLSEFLANGKDRFLEIQLISVCCIDVNANSVQSIFDGLLGSTVKHFVSDRSGVGIPWNKDKLRGGASILGFKLQIDKTVSGFVIRKIAAKVVVRCVSGTLLLDFDYFLTLDFVNVVSDLFLYFELLEFARNDIFACYTGTLRKDFVLKV